MSKKVAVESIRIDGGTQMRERINTDAVDDYAEAYTEGAKMPPLDVFFDGKEFWLANGFHRYHAVRKIGMIEADCIVHKGTLRDAILFAASSNETNGLRRTRADKRTAVTILLHDPEWVQCADNWISDVAKVSRTLVRDCRKQVCLDSPTCTNTSSAKTAERRVGKDGKKRPAKSKARKKMELHVPPIDEAPARKIEIPFQDVGKQIGHNRTEALLQSGCAVLVDKFSDEREWVRTLHDLVAAMRKKQTKLDYDKGAVVHTLTTVANDISEAILSAEEAA